MFRQSLSKSGQGILDAFHARTWAITALSTLTKSETLFPDVHDAESAKYQQEEAGTVPGYVYFEKELSTGNVKLAT